MSGFSGFPTWWVRAKRLKELTAERSTTGAHIAALKVYLALAISADEFLGEVKATFNQLQVVTGLSRPMVSTGLKILEALAVLEVDRSEYRSVYRLEKEEGDRHWGKIPHTLVRARLKELPNSTAVGLAALKAYMTLLAVRQRNSHLAPISHRKLQAYTAIRPNLISRGVSVLIEHGLVRHANALIFKNPDGFSVNHYYLVGEFREGSDTAEDRIAGVPQIPPPESAADQGPLEAERPPAESDFLRLLMS